MEEVDRAKSSVPSSISHDVRTPINTVVSFSSLLTKYADNPDKVREYAKKITVYDQHLLGLILDIGKIMVSETDEGLRY